MSNTVPANKGTLHFFNLCTQSGERLDEDRSHLRAGRQPKMGWNADQPIDAGHRLPSRSSKTRRKLLASPSIKRKTLKKKEASRPGLCYILYIDQLWSSSSSRSSLGGLASSFFQRVLACAASMSGKTRSKTSEYQDTGLPSMPSLMFWKCKVSKWIRE
jgi:hypothetical protein